MKQALFFAHFSSGTGLHDRFEIHDYAESADIPILFSGWINSMCKKIEAETGRGVVVVNCNIFK